MTRAIVGCTRRGLLTSAPWVLIEGGKEGKGREGKGREGKGREGKERKRREEKRGEEKEKEEGGVSVC